MIGAVTDRKLVLVKRGFTEQDAKPLSLTVDDRIRVAFCLISDDFCAFFGLASTANEVPAESSYFKVRGNETLTEVLLQLFSLGAKP